MIKGNHLLIKLISYAILTSMKFLKIGKWVEINFSLLNKIRRLRAMLVIKINVIRKMGAILIESYQMIRDLIFRTFLWSQRRILEIFSSKRSSLLPTMCLSIFKLINLKKRRIRLAAQPLLELNTQMISKLQIKSF